MAAISRETEAIVLDSLEHGESDIILTLLSRDSGRLAAIAKGGKRSKKRFVNKLELFSFLHITYRSSTNRDLGFLAEAELHTGFLNIRKDYDLYCIASVLREFLLLAIRENISDDRLFRLALWALHNIDRKNQPRATLALFLIHFYDCIGYRPDFTVCTRCGLPLKDRIKHSFDSSAGGLVCSSCLPPSKQYPVLSTGTIRMLISAQDRPLEKLHNLKISGGILLEALRLLHNYGRQIFQREIVSWKLMLSDR
jgi:DNA repair protein RecO (recombination protein O)